MLDNKKVGDFISSCRKEKNLTQQQLGEFLGVSDKAVSKWETGRSIPDVTILEPLCNTLGISVGEFFAGEEIAAEEYDKTVEKQLLSALALDKLWIFQVAVYILEFSALTFMLLPIMRTDKLLPSLDPINVICWLMMITAGLGSFLLDKYLPFKLYRRSNVAIEVSHGIISFLLIISVNIVKMYRYGLETFWNSRLSPSYFLIIILICLLIVIYPQMALAKDRRRQAEKEELKIR